MVSDRRTLHIAHNLPFSASTWHRMEDGHCHVDPHALALTPDFFPAIASGSPDTRGRAILINDGGAFFSTDGGNSWTHGKDIATLNVVNLAVNPVGAQGPPPCFGCGDNNGFSSSTGGAKWETQDYRGGDNDGSFSDPVQPSRAIVFAPRSEGPNSVFRQIFLYTSGGSGPPDLAVDTGDRRAIPGPVDITRVPPANKKLAAWNAVSSFFNFGYRPIVLTVPGEAPIPDGDTIIARFTATAAFLMRTWKLSQISSASDWVSSATADGPGVKSFQVGPPLPVFDAAIVQASGGHHSPVFYFGDVVHGNFTSLPEGQMFLWKWTEGMPAWQQIVPPPPPVIFPAALAAAIGPPGVVPVAPDNARRFFVDPYRPSLLYVLSDAHVYRSDTGGLNWVIDVSLEKQLTQGGAFPMNIISDENPAEALLRDMQFDPHRPGTRFACGPAGVFATFDGVHWSALIVSEAIALRPNNLTYDYRSCPRVLYVATFNSGLFAAQPDPAGLGLPDEQPASRHRQHHLAARARPGNRFWSTGRRARRGSHRPARYGAGESVRLQAAAGRRPAERAWQAARAARCVRQNRRVRLEFLRTGCRMGTIIRVISQH